MCLAVLLLVAACSDSSGESAPSTIIVSTTATTDTTAAPTTTEPASTTSTTEATTTTEAATTTTVADSTTTTAAATTTTSDAGQSELLLRPSGVGPVRFGSRPEPAAEFLRGALGQPTDDSGWTGSFSVFGTCPGTEVRGVSFGPLTVLFGDPNGSREFYAWMYDAFSSSDLFGLTTPSGIGLGSTRADIEAAHPSAEFFDDTEPFPPSANFDGFLATFDDAGVVQYLAAGMLCGE